MLKCEVHQEQEYANLTKGTEQRQQVDLHCFHQDIQRKGKEKPCTNEQQEYLIKDQHHLREYADE
jgi:hypothetical protein